MCYTGKCKNELSTGTPDRSQCPEATGGHCTVTVKAVECIHWKSGCVACDDHECPIRAEESK